MRKPRGGALYQATHRWGVEDDHAIGRTDPLTTSRMGEYLSPKYNGHLAVQQRPTGQARNGLAASGGAAVTFKWVPEAP
ncbi:hypothetical protein CDAR_542741 [Caerostris darwini]|uniref:Uncharacterized protein n=1 Tax=Caerostris darwini TaxID=1538125 RepID=A0AAV4WYN8_9ARAC|nr:hypothetical protein CDAR_542741 [Caerostris darwini]